METPQITFVINGRTYRLSTNDTQAMQDMPNADRDQLIALLEAIRQQEAVAAETVELALARAKARSQTSDNHPAAVTLKQPQTPKAERLGRGDADALMARLVMEEQQNRKPGLTRQGLYKFVLGSTVLVIALVLIF